MATKATKSQAPLTEAMDCRSTLELTMNHYLDIAGFVILGIGIYAMHINHEIIGVIVILVAIMCVHDAKLKP